MGVELGVYDLHLFIKLADARQVEEELTTGTEFQNKVQLRLALESISQFYDKWVLYVFLDNSLLNIPTDMT